MPDSFIPHSPHGPHRNLLEGLAGAGGNILWLLFNRIELATCELAEARAHLLKIIVISTLAMLALWFAVACWTVLVILLNWDALGWKIIAVAAGLFSLAAIVLLLYVGALLKNSKLSMPETVDELRKDRDALLSKSEPA